VEQLNVECDRKAKTFVLNTKYSSTAYGNPDITEARLHIRINGKLVCRELLPALRQALSAPAYTSYLKKKLQWNNTDLKDVNWQVLQASLDSFHPNDQRQILLFINDKLPLCASKAHPHLGSTMCPSCQRHEEDHWHFLECQQVDRSALFNMLRGNLTSTTQKLRLHPCFHTVIWLGISSIRHQTPYPDISMEILEPLRAPLAKQQRLGWDQIYQGRTSRQWAQALDTLHPTLPINGTQIMTKIQTTIWTYVLEVWKLHNTHLHNRAAQMDLPNYQ